MPRPDGSTSLGAASLPPASTPHDVAAVPFETFGFDSRLLRALTERGLLQTTPIQSAAIPLALDGIDVIGCAQTGTGKTAAFVAPIIERLLRAPERLGTAIRVLVLAPTRELAVQIDDEFQGFAYYTSISTAAVYGGVAAGGQERALRAPVDVVVATPGRLLDHMRTGVATLDAVEVLVLDEADRMLDMGFWPSVRQIVAALPVNRQTLFFSATMSDEVLRSAAPIMRSPQLVRVEKGGEAASTISHHAHHVPSPRKAMWLAAFLRDTGGPAIVFVRTKRGADRLAQQLSAARVRCVALHADRTQSERTAAVEGFRAGRFTALVATDVAARGLDIDGVAHVINFEVPHSPDAYVHRVGRTGRAGAAGTAVTLIGHEERGALEALERALGTRLFATPNADPAGSIDRTTGETAAGFAAHAVAARRAGRRRGVRTASLESLDAPEGATPGRPRPADRVAL